MIVGDIIEFPIGARRWRGIKSKFGLVLDRQEMPPFYHWIIFADGRQIKLNHNLEAMVKVVNNENR